MEKNEIIIDELFEELTEDSQLTADASCGGAICCACHANFTFPW